jgi:hypothetical protein
MIFGVSVWFANMVGGMEKWKHESHEYGELTKIKYRCGKNNTYFHLPRHLLRHSIKSFLMTPWKLPDEYSVEWETNTQRLNKNETGMEIQILSKTGGKEFYLYKNVELCTFPDLNLSHFSQSQHLILHVKLFNQNIHKIPSTLPDSLRTLEMSNTKVKHIPDNLSTTRLWNLFLSNTRVEEIPPTLPDDLYSLGLSNTTVKHK